MDIDSESDSVSESESVSDSDSIDLISNEEYKKMLENPITLPIHYWDKITEVIIFQNDPNIGSGVFYYCNSPFSSGYFIDEYGNLSQCRLTAEGFWKRECNHHNYKLLFRDYENEQYLYMASKT